MPACNTGKSPLSIITWLHSAFLSHPAPSRSPAVHPLSLHAPTLSPTHPNLLSPRHNPQSCYQCKWLIYQTFFFSPSFPHRTSGSIANWLVHELGHFCRGLRLSRPPLSRYMSVRLSVRHATTSLSFSQVGLTSLTCQRHRPAWRDCSSPSRTSPAPRARLALTNEGLGERPTAKTHEQLDPEISAVYNYLIPRRP